MRSLLFCLWLTSAATTTAYAQASDAPQPEPSSDELAAADDAPPAEDTAPAADPTLSVTLLLKNGIAVKGLVSAQTLLTWNPGDEVSILLEDGHTLMVPGDRIQSIQSGSTPAEPAGTGEAKGQAEAPSPTEEDGFSFPNAAATRYLYTPSAIPMQKGQGYVSQKLLITSVAYAVGDNTTFVLGTFSFFPPALTVAAIKTAFQVGDKVHLGMGGETFLTAFAEDGSDAIASVAFGNITFGDLNTHVTLASGYLNFDGDHEIPIVLAAHHRINDRIAFVTENWLVVDPGNEYTHYKTTETTTTGGEIQGIDSSSTRKTAVGPMAGLLSASVRFIGKRDWEPQIVARGQTTEGYPKSTVDVGLIAGLWRDNPGRLDYNIIGPIPWVDWSWHFGPARR